MDDNSSNKPQARKLKYCQDLPDHNFRKYVDGYLLDAKAIALCGRAKISGTQLSLFRSGRGGMQWDSMIRMMIGMGLKIVDAQGNVILGNPERFDEEIAANTIPDISDENTADQNDQTGSETTSSTES